MKTIKEVIEDIKNKLEPMNIPIYYIKINDIVEYPHIVIIENRRQPLTENMIDKVYESTIEVDYVSNKIPINFYEIYDIRDEMINLLQDDYEVIVSDLEMGDEDWIIHVLLKVKVI